MLVADRIRIDPAICGGKPVIDGTRIAVAVVVGSLAGDMDFAEVAREYDLTDTDIRAGLRYASQQLDAETLLPLRSVAA